MISVALATRDGQRFVRQQLDSMACQTRLPDELIISDDASTDATVEICRRFAQEAPFPVDIRLNAPALGTTSNFARAVGFCRGDLIALADQDDVWLPNKLERLAGQFAASPTVGLAFSDADVVDEQLEPLGYSLWEHAGFTPERRGQIDVDGPFHVLLERNFVTGATTMFRSAILPLALPIPECYRHDKWIALIAAATYELALCPEPLIAYRQHGGQLVGARRRRASQRARAKAVRSLPLALRQRSERSPPIDKELDMLRALQERLCTSAPPSADVRKNIALLDHRIGHWELRSRLPRHFRQRVGVVVAENATGRYRRYSRGVASAAADLLCPPAPRPHS